MAKHRRSPDRDDDRGDDYDDEPLAKKRVRSTTAIALTAGGTLCALVVAVPLLGCAGSSSAPVGAPPAQVAKPGDVGGAGEQNPDHVAEKAKDPKTKEPLRTSTFAFEQAVIGKTRAQIEEKYGAPASQLETKDAGTWDGPASVYVGEFFNGAHRLKSAAIFFAKEEGATVAQRVTYSED